MVKFVLFQLMLKYELENDNVFAFHKECIFWRKKGEMKMENLEVLTHRSQKRRGETNIRSDDEDGKRL